MTPRHLPPTAARALMLLLVLGLLAGRGVAGASLPWARLSTVQPAGGEVGKATEVSVTGTDLEELSELRFSVEGIQAELRKTPESTADSARFLVTIGTNVPPGLYEVRGVARSGVTNPRIFAVGELPELAIEANHRTFATARTIRPGCVVNGVLEANAGDYVKFELRQGERIFAQCESRRIDSQLDPAMILYIGGGRELARARTGGLIDFTAPVDGEYLIYLHDLTYRGGANHFYRLTVRNGPWVDFVFPPAGRAGESGEFTIYGRVLPGGEVVPDWKVNGKPLERLQRTITLPTEANWPARQLAGGLVPARATTRAVAYVLGTEIGKANPVLIGLAELPVVREQEPNDSWERAQQVRLPCEVAGQFYPRNDADWFSFAIKKGEAYSIEVISERMGQPTDPFLLLQTVVKNEKGEAKRADLKEVYDSEANLGGVDYKTSSRDPSWRFEAAEDGECLAQVRDLFNQSADNPARTYRLLIRRESPGFELLAAVQPPPVVNKDLHDVPVWTPYLRRGETIAVKVLVFRSGNFNGEIELSALGLPEYIQCRGGRVEAGKSTATLLFTASADSGEWFGPVRVVGRAGGLGGERLAKAGTVVWPVADYTTETIFSRLSGEMVMAVSGRESSPVDIGLASGALLEAPQAGKLRVPLRVTRRGDFNGVVKLKTVGLQPVKEFEADAKTNMHFLELDLAQIKLPAGRQSFHLEAQTSGKYQRLTLEELNVVGKEAAKADDAAKAAQKQLEEATARWKKAQEALAAANKAQGEAELALKGAEAKTGEKSAEDEKALGEARARRQSALGAKQEAERAESEGGAKVKEAEALKNSTAAVLAALNKRRETRDATFTTYSPWIEFTVLPAPLVVAALEKSDEVRAGEKLEIAVGIQRLFDFKDGVELSLVLPKELEVVTPAKLSLGKEQSQGRLVVETTTKAAAGLHKATLVAAMKFNGQDLKVEKPIELRITPSAANAAKEARKP